jgi:hypothetical protein
MTWVLAAKSFDVTTEKTCALDLSLHSLRFHRRDCCFCARPLAREIEALGWWLVTSLQRSITGVV